jgi:hypothetical protein
MASAAMVTDPRTVMRRIGTLVTAITAITAIAGCAAPVATPLPLGFPLNPCPVAGANAVTPRNGYQLVVPGQVIFGTTTWQNETPDSRACGAQSITGGRTIVRPADFRAGFIPWVATYARAVPLRVPEQTDWEARLFRLTDDGPLLVETIQINSSAEQYGVTLGNLTIPLQEPVVSARYRLIVSSPAGEELATGEFAVAP